MYKPPLKERKTSLPFPDQDFSHLVTTAMAAPSLVMAEEIANSVSKLKIDDEEDLVLNLNTLNPSVENKFSLVLFGRLLTERSYNSEAFKRTITGVWAPPHGLVIRVLSPNFYAFQFFHWKDMNKVLEGRPWCFDNMLILLKEADGDEQPHHVTINHSPFWVRIKNLSFKYSLK